MKVFKIILVANRGEIAVRVIRSAQALGYRCIAVYSEIDARAPHVKMADDAILIGPAPARESYLKIGGILKAAKETSADAIHPGYGFLSENATFARACENEGLVFIGPTADVIESMGDKAVAKRLMTEAGVRCVPGCHSENQSNEDLLKAADEVGYPLIVKAANGGGGRGMRLVEKSEQMTDALEGARSEANNAFGSDALILEKAITHARHVEVQVLADTHGNTIHLGERNCSVQRRYQKIVEEAPCPLISQSLRARIGATAVKAARSIKYRGAGTVEFLIDGSDDFYFLEMNTRLQVEHAVTEMITDLDLVALQIKVAEGHSLRLKQEDIAFNGHAIEARLYAEDPAQDFLPATGDIGLWRPSTGDGIRIDSGIRTGLEISTFYDPMLAKFIAWGESRETARRRLLKALKETTFFGTPNNIRFLIEVLEKETFIKGKMTTAFLSEEFDDSDLAEPTPTPCRAAIAAVIQFLIERQKAFDNSLNVSSTLMNWSNGGPLTTRYVYNSGETEMNLTVTPDCQGCYVVSHGEVEVYIEVIKCADNTALLSINGTRQIVFYSAPHEGVLELSIDGRGLQFRNLIALPTSAETMVGGGRVVAPMHGALLTIFVKPGDQVKNGTRLAVLEAMKMQHDILAEIDGTVEEVLGTIGEQVTANKLLFEIKAT